MKTISTQRHGFTLVELSVVLLIIGLIAGSILVGREMIEAAKIRKVVRELEHYATAIAAFKLKYNCLPGDCLNAVAYFSQGNNCPVSAGPNGTCNGNDDGFISGWWLQPQVVSQPIPYVENHYAWQQLGLAGMVGGQYEGIGHESGGDGQGFVFNRIGRNIPASSYNSNIGYAIFTATNFSDCVMGPEILFPISIQIGSLLKNATANNCGHDFLWGAGFSGTAGRAIDSKVDDGLPASGRFLGRHESGTGANGSGPHADCIVTSINSTEYLNSDVPGCVLYYNLKLW